MYAVIEYIFDEEEYGDSNFRRVAFVTDDKQKALSYQNAKNNSYLGYNRWLEVEIEVVIVK